MAIKALGKDFRLTKDGKIVKVPVYRDVSSRIKARKKPKVRVVRAQ